MSTEAERRGAPAIELGALRGLSEDEARARLATEGPNELPSEKPRSLFALALEVVREPMFLMLVAAGTLYLFMGEPGDALLLLGFVLVVMVITIAQARRTARALDALRDLSSPRALVVRDGVPRRIAGRDVVRGDLVVLAEGDRVPADGILRRASHVSTDESLLTGESVPVRKTPRAEGNTLDAPGGDDLGSVFSGTLVTAGEGIAEVVATGPRSELGKIGKSLRELEPEPTLLEKETRRLVRVLAAVGLAGAGVVVVAFALTRGGSTEAWREGLLAGIAMAMATLPEELPVILTVFLALGAWRISRSQVLTRRMPAIETLGAATVLCVDKTGTLTQNQMTLRALEADGRTADLASHAGPLDPALAVLLEHAVLASKREPFDPMERALTTAAARHLAGPLPADAAWTLAREYPLTPELLAVSYAWATGRGEERVVATKGAPEAIATLCRLDPEAKAHLLADVARLGARGLRVLGVARSVVTALPDAHAALAPTFLGLVALEDPLRPTVASAVAECRTAGVRVVMITGDSPATATSIARQAGLERPDAVLTGAMIADLDDAALAERLREVHVDARVVPREKLRIVEALKRSGEIVAMTGDGVNDAPALKSAHIGIAMGARGTDVAREAASLVLLDDDFSSIVAAIKIGRRVFDNIRKAIGFVIAVHVPILGLSMLPVLFPSWPLFLFPAHIVFLELVIDPSCSLVFEAEGAEPDVMSRPPRRRSERLFSSATLSSAVAQGLAVLGACVAMFLHSRGDHGPDAARASTFVTLVVAFLAVILVNRSPTRSALSMLREENLALRWVLLGTVSLLAVVLFVPPARALLHFAPLHLPDLGLAIAAGITSGGVLEPFKLFRRRRAPR